MKSAPKAKPASISARTLRSALLRFAREREDKTFCPSEVARVLAEDWRPLMPAVRAAGARLVAQNRLRCTQRGQPCDPQRARGPIRFSGVPKDRPTA